MFSSASVLLKQYNLQNVWISSFWNNKLSRSQIMQTRIPESIGVIISNENRIGFNTVGSLLFGLVRIYEKRLKYLQFDCNNIQNKLNPTKQNLDLPKQNNEYAINSGFGNIHEILDIDVENLNIDDIDWINDTNNTNSSILLDSIEIERSRISDINVTTNEGEKQLEDSVFKNDIGGMMSLELESKDENLDLMPETQFTRPVIEEIAKIKRKRENKDIEINTKEYRKKQKTEIKRKNNVIPMPIRHNINESLLNIYRNNLNLREEILPKEKDDTEDAESITINNDFSGDFANNVEETVDEEINYNNYYNTRETDNTNEYDNNTRIFIQVFNEISTGGNVTFNDILSKSENRLSKVSAFFSLLLLKTESAVNVLQSEPFGEITVKKSVKYEEIYNNLVK